MHRIPRLWAVLLVLVLALAWLPSVHGHAVVTVLDNEVHLLHDAADDSYALFDGYDLVDVYAREAWFAEHGEGVVFRFILYGGYQQLLPSSENLSLNFSLKADGVAKWYSLSIAPGGNWTGNMTILDERTQNGTLGETLVLQVFLSHPTMGAARGATLSAFRLESRVGDDLLDVVPGGRYFAGAEIPEDSEAVTPALVLRGPFGYTKTDAMLVGQKVTLNVTNLVTVQDQHILLDAPPVAGWTLEQPAQSGYSVLANQSVSFDLDALVVPGSENLILYVISDLGGRERVSLAAPTPLGGGSAPQPPASIEVERPAPLPESGEGSGSVSGSGQAEESEPSPGPEPGDEDNGTPGVGLLGVLALLGALAAARRR